MAEERGPLTGLPHRRLATEEGFSLIELLFAMMLLAIGIFALAATLDGARDVTTTAERTEAATHAGERALDEVLGRPLDAIAMSCDPRATATVSRCTTTYPQAVDAVYRGQQSLSRNEEMVVSTTAGKVTARETWQDARTGDRGHVYRFVTCAGAPSTPADCLEGSAVKRVVVAVTLDRGDIRRPILLSTFVTDPAGGDPSATGSPCTTGSCQDDES